MFALNINKYMNVHVILSQKHSATPAVQSFPVFKTTCGFQKGENVA